MVSCLPPVDPADVIDGRKRAILLMGASVLPLLHFRAQALESPVGESKSIGSIPV
ncbi:hypothetical protein LINPERPRIM_LOCUS30445 [Linum perenne]